MIIIYNAKKQKIFHLRIFFPKVKIYGPSSPISQIKGIESYFLIQLLNREMVDFLGYK
jgi:hypothetical protein